MYTPLLLYLPSYKPLHRQVPVAVNDARPLVRQVRFALNVDDGVADLQANRESVQSVRQELTRLSEPELLCQSGGLRQKGVSLPAESARHLEHERFEDCAV